MTLSRMITAIMIGLSYWRLPVPLGTPPLVGKRRRRIERPRLVFAFGEPLDSPGTTGLDLN